MGAQHLRIPYGLLRQLCYAGGQRLAPRVNKVPPPEPDVDAEHIPYTFSVNSTSTIGEQVISPTSLSIVGSRQESYVVQGNLKNEAYKFFKGSMIPESNYFQCRGCLIEAYTIAHRPMHMRECRPLMQAIEERIRRDKVCAICNTGTSRETWRIPLCSEACVIKWRFSVPLVWLTARLFVLNDAPHLLRLKCESIQTTS